jgi:hypothetical protein
VFRLPLIDVPVSSLIGILQLVLTSGGKCPSVIEVPGFDANREARRSFALPFKSAPDESAKGTHPPRSLVATLQQKGRSLATPTLLEHSRAAVRRFFIVSPSAWHAPRQLRSMAAREHGRTIP